MCREKERAVKTLGADIRVRTTGNPNATTVPVVYSIFGEEGPCGKRSEPASSEGRRTFL